NRSVVTATLAMAIIGLAFSAWFFWREQKKTEHLLQATELAQRQQEEAKRKAQMETAFARQVVDQMYEQHLLWFRSEPWDTADQFPFLRTAESYYERFASEQDVTPIGRFQRAQALHRVGQIRGSIRTPQAHAPVREAIGLLKNLLEDSPHDFECERELAGCYITEGGLLDRFGQFEQAAASFVLARNGLEKISTAGGGAVKDLEQRANCEYRLGIVQEQYRARDPRRRAEVEAAFLKGEKLFRKQAAKEPPNSEHANHTGA